MLYEVITVGEGTTAKGSCPDRRGGDQGGSVAAHELQSLSLSDGEIRLARRPGESR